MHSYECICGHSLIPTENGWICDECSHTQNWCHAQDLDHKYLDDAEAAYSAFISERYSLKELP